MRNLENEVNSRRDQVERILTRFYTEYPDTPHNGAPSQSLRVKVAINTLKHLFPWQKKSWMQDINFLEDWSTLHRALTIIDKD